MENTIESSIQKGIEHARIFYANDTKEQLIKKIQSAEEGYRLFRVVDHKKYQRLITKYQNKPAQLIEIQDQYETDKRNESYNQSMIQEMKKILSEMK